ncbi:hypothetical protein BGW42_008289 [Actinomortierella wolfii]|nr:hypothetical protein BGW42_008289 [Actinomortierella wolfii]
MEKEWIFLAKSDKLHLLKGNQTYTYDFDLPLPVNLPNSLNMATGKIEYKFTANGKRQTFQLDLDTIRTVDIFQSLPPNHPHCHQPIQSTATFENTLQYHITIPHKAFHHGSIIPARVYLASLAGIVARWHIKHVEVKLKEYFWFIVPEKAIRPEKRTLVSSKQDQWPKETTTVDRMININVPSFNIMSTTDTELIKCSHKLKFKFSVDINGKVKKLGVQFDLYIPGPFPPGQMPAGYTAAGHQFAPQPPTHQPTLQSTCAQTASLAVQPSVVAYGQQPYPIQHLQSYPSSTAPLAPPGIGSPGFPSPGYPPPPYPLTPTTTYSALPQQPVPPSISAPTPPAPIAVLSSPSSSLPTYSFTSNYPPATLDQKQQQNSYQTQSASSTVSYPVPPTPQQQQQQLPPLGASSSPYMTASVVPPSSTPKTSFTQAYGSNSVASPSTSSSHPPTSTPTQSPYTPAVSVPSPPPKTPVSPSPSVPTSSASGLPSASAPGTTKALQSSMAPLPSPADDIKVLVDDSKPHGTSSNHSQNPQTILPPAPPLPPRNPQQSDIQNTADGVSQTIFATPQMSHYTIPPPPASSSTYAAPPPPTNGGVAIPSPSSSSTDALAQQIAQMGISKPGNDDHFVPPPPTSSATVPTSPSPHNTAASQGGYTAPPLSPVTSQVMSPMTAAAAGAVVAATQATGQQQPQQQQQQQQQHVAHVQTPATAPRRQQVWVPYYQTINGTTYVKYIPQHA